MPLAQVPILAYPELVRSGSITLLIGLLSHENADIAIDVIDLLHELTDEDNEADEDENEQQRSSAVKTLIEALVRCTKNRAFCGFPHVYQLENSFLELLVENLSRLNEEEEADSLGVFHILGILENMLAFNPEISKTLIKKTKTLSWILNRIQNPIQDDNRGYAAELLSILLQNNRENRIAYGKDDGVEVSLKVLSVTHPMHFLVSGFSERSPSNSGGRIPPREKNRNSWRMSLMLFVLHLRSPRTKNYS